MELVVGDSPFHLIGAFPGPVRRAQTHKLITYATQSDTPYEGGYYEVVGSETIAQTVN